MNRFFLGLLGFFLYVSAQAQLKIQLDNFASGFIRPVDITHCGDSRLFIVEQDGKIWTLDSLGVKSTTPFLDIDARVNSSGNEQGLLGLAFHPNYAQNGYFYVNYIDAGGDTRIVRFTRDSLNAAKADPNSELLLLKVDQPFSNHNGGCLKFGPDGHLYASLGDGGSAGDPQDHGQRKSSYLGKMLRLDVNNPGQGLNYGIPADNPFVGNSDYLPEIWSMGLRNVWRFSFDRLTGDMWMGDVGQNKFEEVDYEPANTGGRNYGWRCYEGNQPYNATGCQPAANYISPAFAYGNPSKGCSVTGGFVYRGTKYPLLYGVYLVADYCSGRFWAIRKNADGSFSTEEAANLGDYEFSAFGEDIKGELYVALLSSGKIQKVKDLCSAFQVSASFPNGTALCAGVSNGEIALTAGGVPGTISYQWSNGATTSSLEGLSTGNYLVTVTSSSGCSSTAIYSFTQTGPEIPAISSSSNVICPGGSVIVYVQNIPSPATLNITAPGGAGNIVVAPGPIYSFNAAEAGVYQVQVIDTVCSPSSEITLDSEIGIPPMILVNKDTLSSATSWPAYQWYLNNAPIPGANDSTWVATESGNYELYTFSLNGCSYQSGGVDIIISGTTLPTSFQKFDLSPNPTPGLSTLNIRLKEMQRMRIFLLDGLQQQIFSQTKQTDTLSLPIDLHALPAGTYFLHVQLENGDQVIRKIIRK